MNLPARRLKRAINGGIQSVSAPAGVSDEDVWAEVDRMHERVKKGYTRPADLDRGFKVNLRTISRYPRPIVKLVLFAQRLSRIDYKGPFYWLKWRALDIYWFFKGKK